MVSINWKKFFSYFITLLIGLVIGWFIRGEQKIIKEVTKIERHTDTTVVEKEIEVKSPAKIIYLPSPITDKPPQSGYPEPALEEVAHWDTSTAEGFKAEIKYYTASKFFSNKFTIPEKVIETTEVVTKQVTISQMPAYMFSIGARMNYQDEMLKGYPFLSLLANSKFLFLNYSVELKTLADIKGNGISIIPELEGRFNIPFD